jgi:hypothetical protein
VKLRSTRDLTIVSPSVTVERSPRRSARVACRSESVSARRAERQPPVDQKFRYFVDSNGRQHFNFVQRVWLQPQVEMAVTPVPTVALATLAVNLLTEVTRERDYAAVVGITSRRVMQLASKFCDECLLTARGNGWVIPRASVKSWVAAHLRKRSTNSP